GRDREEGCRRRPLDRGWSRDRRSEEAEVRKPVRREVLRDRLDTLVATFDVSTIEPDPLQLVRRYNDLLDAEVAGLLAAAFAYGRADIVVSNVGAVLAKMRQSPYP